MAKAEKITDNLFIKDLIRKVHEELLASQEEREQSGIDPLFYVKDMTIEANFIAEKSVEAEGGVSFKFLTVDAQIGGGGKIQAQQVHKITLNLITEPNVEITLSPEKQPSKSTSVKPVKRIKGVYPRVMPKRKKLD